MPWVHKASIPKTPAQLVKEIEESNARPGLKVNICADCKLKGKERVAYPTDPEAPDNYMDHIKTHEN